jgi:protein-tyrosine phosphatase
MISVLMVCLGNICRSPLAQGILESKVSSNTIYVDSAGTSAHHQGELPDIRSIEIAKVKGLDITDQRSRAFDKSDFQKFDWIYAMDKSNYYNLQKLASSPEERAKIKLILNGVDLDVDEVPDPYYGGDQGFSNVYDLLDAACDYLLISDLTDG